MQNLIFSIVTVCYNAERTIRETLESVLSQTNDEFEYIIIDGKSTDKTLEIVHEYKCRFQEKGIIYRVYSEPDKGIYDAMNKGSDKAEGEWIYFLNADDKLYDNRVLEQVRPQLEKDVAVVYGNVRRVYKDHVVLREGESMEVVGHHMPYNHQSAFTRTEIQKKYRFNEEYRVVADYDMIARMYRNKENFKKMDVVVADFSVLGFSNENKYRTYLDMIRVQHDNGFINKDSFVMKLKRAFHYIRLNAGRWKKVGS